MTSKSELLLLVLWKRTLSALVATRAIFLGEGEQTKLRKEGTKKDDEGKERHHRRTPPKN